MMLSRQMFQLSENVCAMCSTACLSDSNYRYISFAGMSERTRAAEEEESRVVTGGQGAADYRALPHAIEMSYTPICVLTL